jgi:hypothetical protein
MDTWCFIDESWQEKDGQHIGILAAVLCPWNTHEALDNCMFRVRRKYFGESHAKNRQLELKAKELLSNTTFRKSQGPDGYSKNLCVVREVLEFASQQNIRVIIGTIRSKTKPRLLAPDPRQLETPFLRLCERVMAHMKPGKRALLVFDQRIRAQEDISVALTNFLAGLPQNVSRIHPLPLIAISNVCAGIQLADLMAHVAGRTSLSDQRVRPFYKLIQKLEMKATDRRGFSRNGFFHLHLNADGSYTGKSKATKKEPGAPGQDADESGQDST